MAVTGFFHHVGAFFLFVATVLLIVTCITAPVVHDLAIMKVDLARSAGGSESAGISFGTFGFCATDINGSDDQCSNAQVGYSPADVMTAYENTEFSDYARDSTARLTKVMILHPVAAGMNFIAFALAVGSGVFGSLVAAAVAGLSFIITCIVLICDFVLFSIVRSNVNDDGSGSRAYFATGIWTILVSGICSLIGAIIVLLTCCSARMHRQRGARTSVEAGRKDDYGVPARRRRRWF